MSMEISEKPTLERTEPDASSSITDWINYYYRLVESDDYRIYRLGDIEKMPIVCKEDAIARLFATNVMMEKDRDEILQRILANEILTGTRPTDISEDYIRKDFMEQFGLKPLSKAIFPKRNIHDKKEAERAAELKNYMLKNCTSSRG